MASPPTIKLLHVIGSLDQRTGGPLRAVLDLSAASIAHGVQSELVSVGEIHLLDNPLEPGSLHCLPLKMPNAYRYTPELGPWLRTNIRRYDCVILHGMWLFPELAAARACWKWGVPYAVFPHGMLEPWSVREQGTWKYIKKLAYWELFEREIFERARCSLFTTRKEMSQAREVFRFRWPSRVVAPYGVASAQVADSMQVEEGVPQLEGFKFTLFLGRLHPCKNIPLLLRAWARAMAKTEWKLAIVGPSTGDYLEQIKRLATELGVRDQCVFLDFAAGATKRWLLENARWFALPSEHENFGVAMFEALAHQCPVVVSDQVYSAEFLEPHGRILPLREERWVEFFLTRLQDEEYRNRVIASDMAVIDGYKMDKVAQKWTDLLHSVFGGGSNGELITRFA
jgi:glycosyltransferase involved in cell wall biosynthesis